MSEKKIIAVSPVLLHDCLYHLCWLTQAVELVVGPDGENGPQSVQDKMMECRQLRNELMDLIQGKTERMSPEKRN